jgi:hypothetical protein
MYSNIKQLGENFGLSTLEIKNTIDIVILFLINAGVHSLYPEFLKKILNVQNISWLDSILRVPLPIDESVWSHLKMAYTSTFIYSLIRKKSLNAMLTGTLIAGWLVPLFFYGYVSATKQAFLAVDIFITFLISILAYAYIEFAQKNLKMNAIIFALVLILHVLFFIIAVQHSRGKPIIFSDIFTEGE